MSKPPSRIARVAVPVPLHRLFDYSVPESMQLPVIGARVVVPFSGRRLVGVVTALNPDDAHDKVRPLSTVLDAESVLGDEVFALASWLSSYYQHPLGEVLTTLLPGAARKPEPLKIRRPEVWELAVSEADLKRAPKQQALFELISRSGGRLAAEDIRAAGFERSHLRGLAAKGFIRKCEAVAGTPPRPEVDLPELNPEQAAALAALTRGEGFHPVLLDGITGSGKTEVYLRFIEQVLDAGRQVLVLVPEIALTPQTLARFEARFGAAAVMHSNLTDTARLQVWLKVRSGEARILIGTRSAVLTPFADLGLIVVDEEHDSLVQADRRVALFRQGPGGKKGKGSRHPAHSRQRHAELRVAEQCARRPLSASPAHRTCRWRQPAHI